MSETIQGTLRLRMTKRGVQVVLDVPTKKGSATRPVNENQLDKALQAQYPNGLDGMEVDYETDRNGSPLRVRPPGQGWEAGQSSAAASHKGAGKSSKKKSSGVQAGASHQTPRREPGAFHNPYNFVPALPRDRVEGELGDRTPSGHARFLPDRWSGTVRVRMTTLTPLLIPDAARRTVGKRDHVILPMRQDGDQPLIPTTSIRGALRSAYEAVTNSRMGVFQGHDQRLGYRRSATSGAGMVPVRIVKVIDDKNPANCEVDLELLTGTSTIGQGGLPARGDPVYAAWLHSYAQGYGKDRQNAPSAFRRLRDGDRVWAYVTYWRHQRFSFWNVADIQPHSPSLPTSTPVDRRQPWRQGRVAPDGSKPDRWVEGWVYKSNQNIDRKHDERVFFYDGGPTPTRRYVGDDAKRLINDWKNLIEDYRAQHTDEEVCKREDPHSPGRSVRPDVYLGREPGKTAWSKHIYEGTRKTLDSGRLCYATVKEQGGSAEVDRLYPVMIARDLYETAPGALLPEGISPADSRRTLSPAERVFGWVKGEAGGTEGAHRGQLRIGTVTPVEVRTSAFDGPGVPLQILGEPKPTMSRFYVGEKDEKDVCPVPDGREKGKNYRKGQTLRGRKAYPHQAHLAGNRAYWAEPAEDRTQTPRNMPGSRLDYYQEYRRPDAPVRDQRGKPVRKDGEILKTARDNQNRSVTGWVEMDSAFEFDIHLINLSDVELGALLYLLTLEGGAAHRIGGGKPLGFGSVSLQLKSADMKRGHDWRDIYLDLCGSASHGNEEPALDSAWVEGLVAKFRNAVKDAYGRTFDEVSFIAAFDAAAKGYDDDLPVHYPRSTDRSDPEGKNFEWFTANDRVERGTLKGYALPALRRKSVGFPLLALRARG